MSYPLALPQVKGPVFELSEEILRDGFQASRQSPRRRIILPVHRTSTEGVQRMINFMQHGSYARPHRHPAAENIETVITVAGEFAFFTFTPSGEVQSKHHLRAGGRGPYMVDIEAGVWHTVVPLADDSAIFEIKRGPYNAATDKEFAPWAPIEGCEEAPVYLARLEALIRSPSRAPSDP